MTATAEAPAEKHARLLPIWLIGLANLPYGLVGGVALFIMPQLLASRGVPEVKIATLTSIALVPSFSSFLLGPLLDVWFSRRSYASVFTVLSGVFTVACFLFTWNLTALTWLLFIDFVCANLFLAAFSGWITSIIPQEDESTFAAWGNI